MTMMDDRSGLLAEAGRLIDEYRLDYGDAEAFYGRVAPWSDVLYVAVEAPNHSTICASVPGDSTITDLRRELAGLMRGFDADVEFDETWSSEVGERDGVPPSEALGMLQEDMAFFRMTADRLDGTRDYGDAVLAEVRWTDSDLRFLLMRHLMPVTGVNLDTMRRQLDGQAIRNESIRHGWEVIESMIDWYSLDPDPDADERERTRGDDTDDVCFLMDPADPVGSSLDPAVPGGSRGLRGW